MRCAVAIIAALAIVAGVAVAVANANPHAPTVHQTTDVRGRTHPNHATDDVGAAACAQGSPPAVAPPPIRSGMGIVKCATKTNRIYKFWAPWPQVGVVPNPPAWDSTGSITIPDATLPGQLWWWTRAAGSRPGLPSGVSIYVPIRHPNGATGILSAWAVVEAGASEFMHPLDGDAPGRTMLPRPTVIIGNPPADFIR